MVSINRAADGRRQRSRKIVIKREKRTGPTTDPCRTPQQTRKENFCDFVKPCKRAYQKGKIESNKAKLEGRPPEMSLWKRAGCLTESKAFKKSIVERIIQERGLGLLNPSEME